MPHSLSAPVPKQERIQFIDALRGFALLGILLMNIMSQGQAHFYYTTMNLSQSITGPNYWAWLIESLFFEGTMRGLFSILFGAGTILLITRLEKKKAGLEPADIYYRRLLWLLAFGLLNAFILLWPGDILYPYALGGLLLFPFRNWSARNLFLASLFFLAIATYRVNSDLQDSKNTISKGKAIEQLAQKQSLSETQNDDLKKYQTYKSDNTKEGIAKAAAKEEKQVKGQSYATVFKYYMDRNMRRQSLGMYNFMIWDVLIFFFLGMALFKSGFITGKHPVYLYAAVGIVATSLGLLLNYQEQHLLYNLKFDRYEFVQQYSFDTYQVRRVLQTIGYLSCLILLYKWLPFRKLFDVFRPVGQMAFTNYLSQSIITSIIFYGFGLFAALQRYQLYYIVVAIWVFQIVFSHIWLRYYSFGPFEWLWRSLTYWKKQPLKITTAKEELQATPELITPAIA